MLSGGCATSSIHGEDAGGGVDASAAPVDAARPPDAMPAPDAPSVGPTFVLHETAADWQADGASFDGATVEPYDALGPVAYYTGGLRVRGVDADGFSDATSETWADVEAMTFTGQTGLARSLDTAWGAAIPPGVGLTSGDDLTLAYDGEIYLEAGSWTFYLLADDHGFLELAPPGTASYTRVASADWPDEASGSFDATTDGWYGIRLAESEGSGSASVRVQLSGPGIPSQIDVPHHRLRARADALTGLAMTGFDDSFLLGANASTVDTMAPTNVNWADGSPADVGLTSADDFSVRWAGQFRVDTGGDYTLRFLTDDGQRLWIDGALELDAWDASAHDNTTGTLSLEPGWHDIVAAVSEATGTARAVLTVASGPTGALSPIPVDHLRPVESRRERVDGAVDRTDRAIPDNGSVSSSAYVDAPIGSKVDGVEVSWTFDHSYQGDLEIRLIAPDGSTALLRNNEGGAAAGTVTQRIFTHALDSATAAGTWKLQVSDTVSLDTGTLRDFQVTVQHHGGAAPIPAVATYESPVIDLGIVVSLDALSWGARLAAGAAVQLRVRTGGSPLELSNAPWSTPVLDSGGAEVPELPRRYFQYRVEMTSDGDGAAAVDWVRLDYTREGP